MRRTLPPLVPIVPLVLLLLIPGAAAAAAPRLEPSAGDWAALTGLPPLLGMEEVRKQLATGLTTTLAFQVRATVPGRGRVDGGARVDIRYELWDEVYLVTRIDAAGRAIRASFPSFERLAEWWREAKLDVARLPRAAGQPAWRVEVRLRLIPFSQSEQLETQRWFSQALAAEEPGSAGAVSRALEEQPETLGQVLNLLLATSIQRPALLEQEWNLTFPSGTGPAGAGRKR